MECEKKLLPETLENFSEFLHTHTTVNTFLHKLYKQIDTLSESGLKGTKFVPLFFLQKLYFHI